MEESVELEEVRVSSSEGITDRVLTLANCITFLRLLLIPISMWVFLGLKMNVLAFLLYVVAALSDFLDGKVARATNTVSKLGMKLDPVVDRLLILSGVICIFVSRRAPIWLLLLIFGRDLVLAIFFIVKPEYRKTFRVAYIGKVTTWFVMAGFASLMLNWPTLPGLGLFEISFLPGFGTAPTILGIWFLYVGVVFSWITAALYFHRGMKA